MLLLETNLVRDDNTLEAMIAALPTSWKARILRKKPRFSRVQSAIAYTMLADILKNTYHLPALPAIETAVNGKPYLVDCPLYFSISHCDAAVAVVVDTVPVGVDVQTVLKDISPALAARIAAPLDEKGYIATSTEMLLSDKWMGFVPVNAEPNSSDTQTSATPIYNNDEIAPMSTVTISCKNKVIVDDIHICGTVNNTISDPTVSTSNDNPNGINEHSHNTTRKPEDLSPTEFTRLWTIKEASAKLDGRGLKIGLENLPIKGHRLEMSFNSLYFIVVAK